MTLRLQHIERIDDALPPIDDADDVGHPRLAPVPVAPLRRAGRKTSYQRDYAQMARGYCLLGATNRQLAKLFGISTETLDTWMDCHPEFGQAIEEGRSTADMFVADSIYRRATGYTQKICTVVRETRTTGDQVTVIERTTETDLHVPADPSAASRWLHLRQNMHDPDRNALTVDDIIRIAEMARAEAARRGIDYTTAIDGTVEG
jgi:hypothetical protein